MAYTVEHDNDQTEIVILDPSGDDLDVNIMMDGDNIYITQTDPNTGDTDLVALTPGMYKELIMSYAAEEGFHR